jgi:Cd2+/Zn2+-exporting ATPase
MQETKSDTRKHAETCSCCAPDNDVITLSEPAGENLVRYNVSGGRKKVFILKKAYLPASVSLLMLIAGVAGDYVFQPALFSGPVRIAWYIAAYLPVGFPVFKKALTAVSRGNIFTEFFLMTIASFGAFAIGQYSESVAVMLFYTIGELFQDEAVRAAKRSIKSLLDIRPDQVTVLRHGIPQVIHPSQVAAGETIQVKPGEKVALDGVLLSDTAAFNTAALSGESRPDNKHRGETVLASMISLHAVVTIKVTALFKDSKLSRILQMVQEASARKSKTQLFITRFARIYTPAVVFLAACVCLLPWIFTDHYVFQQWLYRSLFFLVISCPCALVISIPLGYFGGIGLASRHGILFKGANFLDLVSRVNVIALDKTGTLTRGVFKVRKIVSKEIDKPLLIRLTATLESNSTHPIASAIIAYAGNQPPAAATKNVREIAGLGLTGTVDGYEIVAGSPKLLQSLHIAYDKEVDALTDTVVVVSVNRKYAGYITIADEIKPDSRQAIAGLQALHIKTVMLSGDKTQVTQKTGKILGVGEAYGDLLPEDKMKVVEKLKDKNHTVAFLGDGVNDAPVIALADIGIAMGGLGSDAAIEIADIVIQNDQPSKILSAIRIGKLTRSVVWQNIILAMSVKALVLLLGAVGLATLWEAVFADVGVALLAVLNAVRIQNTTL